MYYLVRYKTTNPEFRLYSDRHKPAIGLLQAILVLLRETKALVGASFCAYTARSVVSQLDICQTSFPLETETYTIGRKKNQKCAYQKLLTLQVVTNT